MGFGFMAVAGKASGSEVGSERAQIGDAPQLERAGREQRQAVETGERFRVRPAQRRGLPIGVRKGRQNEAELTDDGIGPGAVVGVIPVEEGVSGMVGGKFQRAGDSVVGGEGAGQRQDELTVRPCERDARRGAGCRSSSRSLRRPCWQASLRRIESSGDKACRWPLGPSRKMGLIRPVEGS